MSCHWGPWRYECYWDQYQTLYFLFRSQTFSEGSLGSELSCYSNYIGGLPCSVFSFAFLVSYWEVAEVLIPCRSSKTPSERKAERIASLKGEESRRGQKKEGKQKEGEEGSKRKEENHQKFLVTRLRKFFSKFTASDSFICKSGNIKVPKWGRL